MFQEIRPCGAGLKTDDFVTETWGGATYRKTTRGSDRLCVSAGDICRDDRIAVVTNDNMVGQGYVVWANACYDRGAHLLRYGLKRPVIIPIVRSFGWISYDKVGVLYSTKLENRSEAHVPPISEAIRGSGGME